MKTLKLTLGAVLLSSFFFVACDKEDSKVENDQDNVRSIFTPADSENTEQEMHELDQILKGNIETVEVITPRAAAPVACCLNKVLAKVTAPWDPTLINLNLQYDVSDPNQVVQIKHWVNTGGGYVYFGQDNIGTSYTTCTSKSVNMGTNHIPSGTIISWSRIYDGTTGGYCGGSKILTWTK
jgi:hypothetical protein